MFAASIVGKRLCRVVLVNELEPGGNPQLTVSIIGPTDSDPTTVLCWFVLGSAAHLTVLFLMRHARCAATAPSCVMSSRCLTGTRPARFLIYARL